MTRNGPVSHGALSRPTHAAVPRRRLAGSLALAFVAAGVGASGLDWDGLRPKADAAMPAELVAALDEARTSDPSRIIAGVLDPATAAAAASPTRIVAVPATTRIFAEHAALADAPPAVLTMVPEWRLLRSVGALVVTEPDEAGAFTLTLDSREWRVAA